MTRLEPIVPQTEPSAPDAASGASTAGIEVGPGKKLPDLHSVAPCSARRRRAAAGNASYRGGVRFTRSGTADRPITIRGGSVDGKRPLVEAAWTPSSDR